MIDCQSVAELDSAGLCNSVPDVPFPSWPFSFLPQAQNELSVFCTNVWYQPAFGLIQSVEEPICLGVKLWLVVPSPNCPLPLCPQAQRVPLVLIAIECWSPTDIFCQLLSKPIWIGILLSIVVPSPIWPE